MNCVFSGSEEIANDELTDSAEDVSFNRVRRGFNMLRLGRGLQMLRLGKRALPMLRLGRSSPDRMDNDELQYWLSLIRDDRQVPLPRYGKDLALQYVLMKALKNADDGSNDYFEDGFDGFGYGYPYASTAERQIRPAPRPGRYRRSADAEPPMAEVDEKTINAAEEDLNEDYDYKYPYARVAPLMRYGKYAPYEGESDLDKRAMRMLRLGRGMRMLRLGKRPSDSVAMDEDAAEADKRALRLLRLGKRPAFRMLRLGRSGETDPEEEKRALRLLRLGKKSETEES